MGQLDIRVLVVDDDESMRATLQEYISNLGVRVRTAADVAGARRQIQFETPPFDVVLTDLKLPDGSGLDVVRAVRERSSSSLVSVITGYASLETAIEAIRLGAHDYVTKPFSLDQIGIDVRNMIDRVSLTRENARLSVQLQAVLEEVSRLRSEKVELVRLHGEILRELRDNGRKLDRLVEGNQYSEPAAVVPDGLARPGGAPAPPRGTEVAPGARTAGYPAPRIESQKQAAAPRRFGGTA